MTSICENDTEYEPETLELIWNRAARICESSSVKNFLQKRGKLASVRVIQGDLRLILATNTFNPLFSQRRFNSHTMHQFLLLISGVAVADLEFDHPDDVSRAEKSWKVIASLLQRILGYNVELRINLANNAPYKQSKLKTSSLNLFSCSRRVHLQSQLCVECGSSVSDYSTVCHGNEAVSSIRNSDGNALSIGIRTPRTSFLDSMDRENVAGAESLSNGITNRVEYPQCIEPESRSRYTTLKNFYYKLTRFIIEYSKINQSVKFCTEFLLFRKSLVIQTKYVISFRVSSDEKSFGSYIVGEP